MSSLTFNICTVDEVYINPVTKNPWFDLNDLDSFEDLLFSCPNVFCETELYISFTYSEIRYNMTLICNSESVTSQTHFGFPEVLKEAAFQVLMVWGRTHPNLYPADLNKSFWAGYDVV